MSNRKSKSQSDPFDTEPVMRANVEKLRRMLESIEMNGDGEHPSTVADLARTSAALTAACAEIRQHAKSVQRALDDYPPEQLVASLKRRLSSDELAEIARDLTGERDTESLL